MASGERPCSSRCWDIRTPLLGHCSHGSGVILVPSFRALVLDFSVGRNPFLYLLQAPTHLPPPFCLESSTPSFVCPTKSYSSLQSHLSVTFPYIFPRSDESLLSPLNGTFS